MSRWVVLFPQLIPFKRTRQFLKLKSLLFSWPCFLNVKPEKAFCSSPSLVYLGEGRGRFRKLTKWSRGGEEKKKQMKLKFLTSEQHFTPSMYELKSACVVVSKNRTGVVVALAEFVTVEHRALSISTKTNPAIAFSCVETFFIGQKTSCDLLNQ